MSETRARVVRVPWNAAEMGVAAVEWGGLAEDGDTVALLLPVTFEDGEPVVHAGWLKVGKYGVTNRMPVGRGWDEFCMALLSLARGARPTEEG